MMRRPSATVRVIRLPHLHPEAVRVEVDCRFSTTGITSIPAGPIKLTRAQLVTFATAEHEARCGRCCTTLSSYAAPWPDGGTDHARR